MKRRFVLIVAGVASRLSMGCWRCGSLHRARGGKRSDDNGYSQIAVFAKAVELLRQDYVDGNKTSYHDLIYAAMKGMLSSLDPHSQFMEPNDFRTCRMTPAAVSTASASKSR